MSYDRIAVRCSEVESPTMSNLKHFRIEEVLYICESYHRDTSVIQESKLNSGISCFYLDKTNKIISIIICFK